MIIKHSNKRKKKGKRKRERKIPIQLSKPKILSSHKHEMREYEGLEIIP
jgi:hypothetical protein